jgi:NAD(P)H dehydrogenase (quinone)
MKIGIIVHSKTGHSNLVAQKLKEKLILGGHAVALERITTFNDGETDTGKIQFQYIPGIEVYDMLIFGAPVRGFSLSPVMNAYISQIKTLQGIKVGAFVTQFFPFKQMGGERSIKQLVNLCELKGGKVYKTGIINWTNIKRERQIDNLIKNMSSL